MQLDPEPEPEALYFAQSSQASFDNQDAFLNGMDK